MTTIERVEPLSDEERLARAEASAGAAKDTGAEVATSKRQTKAQLKKLGRARAENIRRMLEAATITFETIAIQLAEVKQDEAEWKSMGYESFAEYLDGEYANDLFKCGTALRKAIVASKSIKRAGLTAPELAAITGATPRTIERDRAADRQMSENPTGGVGKDSLVLLEDDGDKPEEPETTEPDIPAEPETVPLPLHDWDVFAAALKEFNRNHALSKPDEVQLKAVRFRLGKASKIVQAMEAEAAAQ